MNKHCINGIKVCAGITGALLSSPALADINIPENIAREKPTPINIIPGQTVAINFKNDDRVSFLILSSQSEIAYTTNAPVESGQAKSIFLKNIKPLDFPGEINSDNPNLFVVAIDSQGNQEQYEFIVDNSRSHSSEINIVSERKKVIQKPANIINTELGAASPEDVRIGLKHKLKKGSISPEDPVVVYTAEAIAATLNSEKDLIALASELNIPLSVLSEFGRIGLAQKTKYRIQADRKKTNALKAARLSLIDRQNNAFLINTDLGQANLEDIKFGLSVMQSKETITKDKAQKISKIIERAKNNPSNLSSEDKNQLQSVGRLGLAFSSRLRIWGTIY